jgi:E3 Ubiquitin ligase
VLAIWLCSSKLSSDHSSGRFSDQGGLFFWCVIGVCAGMGCFFYGFRLLQKRRLILDTPFSKIRSAAMGIVEVSGLAVGPYAVVAPITARLCYYYRTIVWEWKQNGKNKSWVKVAGECVHVPFFLDDNTGRVLVDPRGADLDIHRDFHQEFCDSFFTTKDPAPENVRSFLANHGIATSNKIRVEEFCIKPKNSLFILGTLAENPGMEAKAQPMREDVILTSTGSLQESLGITLSTPVSFSMVFGSASGDLSLANPLTRIDSHREVVQPEVIQLSHGIGPTKSVEMTQQQKIAAALLKAGISNPAAWSAAGLGAPAVQVIQDAEVTGSGNGDKSGDGNSGAGNGFDPHPPVVLAKGTNNEAFVISWRSQLEVARSLGWKCALMILGGPALVLVSLYLLLNMR